MTLLFLLKGNFDRFEGSLSLARNNQNRFLGITQAANPVMMIEGRAE